MAGLEEAEKRDLAEVAKSPIGEEEKRALVRKIKEQSQAARTQVLELIAKAKPPAIQ